VKFRLYIRLGDKRVAEDVELDSAPTPGRVLELPDGRRFDNIIETSGSKHGYDGLFSVDPARDR
jgi:hypothetical protein